jgi:hypothetical protein
MSSLSGITSPRVDPNAKPDALPLRHVRLAVSHPSLNLNSAPDGVDYARELDQEPVAGILHAHLRTKNRQQTKTTI